MIETNNEMVEGASQIFGCARKQYGLVMHPIQSYTCESEKGTNRERYFVQLLILDFHGIN